MSAVLVSTYDTIRDHTNHLLTSLGDTPTTIAATLAAAGIRGERCNEGTCPIATFLMASDLGLHSVEVDSDAIVLFLGDHGGTWVHPRLPAAVEEFIDRFDQGAYDNLLAEGGTR